LDRLQGMQEGDHPSSSEYLRGLREAVIRGVEYGIEMLEVGGRPSPEIPIAVIAQARLAAREGVTLELVVRKYLAGKRLLTDFILEEASATGGPPPLVLREVLGTLESAFDHLLSVATEEHRRETAHRRNPQEPRMIGVVRRLLAAEPVDHSALGYDLDHHHLGIIAGSIEARHLIKLLAAESDSRPLMVTTASNEVWAWLGSRQPFDPEAIHRLAASACSAAVPLGLGEPMRSPSGWRLTHRQARAAYSVAKESTAGAVRYAQVAIIACAAKDPLLTTSLNELYLSPLREGRDEGKLLRATLRAYFAADRNSSSAASALGVSRQTVTNRLRQVEDRVGQPLSMCAPALETALCLEAFEQRAVDGDQR
jgi:PucR-like helix-turn-helix protein/diguanylate cyclase with GGDEF domain